MNELLDAYTKKFYGYGSYQGKFWFIGKEEGGGKDYEEINERLKIWDKRGQLEVEDLAEYHKALKVEKYFRDERPALQSTWTKLIRIFLSAQGHENITTDEIRQYQRDQLGRPNDKIAILELLPLPSPTTSHWIYADLGMDRNTYRENFAPWRAEHIRECIQEHKPKAVVFYSMDRWYQQWWKAIAGGITFQPESNFLIGKDQNTVYAMISHPTAHGIKNDYFHTVGRRLAALGK